MGNVFPGESTEGYGCEVRGGCNVVETVEEGGFVCR